MASKNVYNKMQNLIGMDAEKIMAETIKTWNKSKQNGTLQVVLNIADDIGGAWSHKAMTDYNNRFDISPLFNRHFVTPLPICFGNILKRND